MRYAMRSLLLAATAAVLAAPLAAQPLAGGPVIPVYSSNDDKGFSPAVAAAPGGGFGVVWRRNTDNAIVARAFRADGVPVTPASTQVSSPDDPFFGYVRPDLAALSSGGYAATWTRIFGVQSSVLLRLLDSAGRPAGPVINLGDQLTGSHVAADATGRFVVALEGNGSPPFDGVAARRFGADGAPVTPVVAIDPGGSLSDVSSFPDGSFVVVWRGIDGLFFQLFGPVANPLAPPHLIHALSGDTGLERVRVSAIAGRFVTVWSETLFAPAANRILARLWDAGGLPLGPEIVVAEAPSSSERLFLKHVAMRSDGSFLVQWEGNQPRGRRFDPQGVPVGDPFAIPVFGGIGMGDVAAAGNTWLLAWPENDLAAAPAEGPWVQRLISSCGEPAALGLCLNGRFHVEVSWHVPANGWRGAGTPIPLTAETGAFWFFAPANYELVVKILDGRGVNGHFWVFFGSLTNVEFHLTVTDTVTGQQRTYHNPAGTMASRADTEAF